MKLIIVPPGAHRLDSPIELDGSVRMVGSRYLIEGAAREALHDDRLNLLVIDVSEKRRITLAARVRERASTLNSWALEIWHQHGPRIWRWFIDHLHAARRFLSHVRSSGDTYGV